MVARGGDEEAACRLAGRGWKAVAMLLVLVEDLQAELEDSGLEGAGDGAAGSRWSTEGSSETAGRQEEVGGIEEIVGLRSGLDLQAFDRGDEPLVGGRGGLGERGGG